MNDKYLEAEKRLAGLLGWKNVKDVGWPHWGEPPGFGMLKLPDGERCMVPCWTRDNAAAFALMVEYNVGYAPYIPDLAIAICGEYAARELIADHPDKETAVRYAIVQAVIAKLEQEKNT